MRLIVESPAPDLKESLSYYKNVGFQCSALEEMLTYVKPKISLFFSIQIPIAALALTYLERRREKTTVSPSGTWIKERKENIKYSTPDTKSLLGNYAGVCVETLDLEASFVFWQAKGFKGKLNRNASWCQLENKNGDRLSLLQGKQLSTSFY